MNYHNTDYSKEEAVLAFNVILCDSSHSADIVKTEEGEYCSYLILKFESQDTLQMYGLFVDIGDEDNGTTAETVFCLYLSKYLETIAATMSLYEKMFQSHKIKQIQDYLMPEHKCLVAFPEDDERFEGFLDLLKQLEENDDEEFEILPDTD